MQGVSRKETKWPWTLTRASIICSLYVTIICVYLSNFSQSQNEKLHRKAGFKYNGASVIRTLWFPVKICKNKPQRFLKPGAHARCAGPGSAFDLWYRFRKTCTWLNELMHYYVYVYIKVTVIFSSFSIYRKTYKLFISDILTTNRL